MDVYERPLLERALAVRIPTSTGERMLTGTEMRVVVAGLVSGSSDSVLDAFSEMATLADVTPTAAARALVVLVESGVIAER